MVSGYTLTTFPNAICAVTATTKVKAKATINNKLPQRAVCSQRGIGTAHKLVEKIWTAGFYPTIKRKRKTEEEKERGISQPSIHQK